MSGVASANWAETSARRSRRAAGPSVVDRPPDRSARSIPIDELWIAGTRPPRRMSAPLPAAKSGEPSEYRRGQPDLVDARDVVDAVRRHEVDREEGDADPHGRGAGRQDAALDDEMLQEPAPRRAKRAANRQLAAPVERARDEQVDRVRAGDEEHAPDRGEHDEERRAHVADDAAPSDPAGPTWLSRPDTTISRWERAARSWRAACRAPPRGTHQGAAGPAPS